MTVPLLWCWRAICKHGTTHKFPSDVVTNRAVEIYFVILFKENSYGTILQRHSLNSHIAVASGSRRFDPRMTAFRMISITSTTWRRAWGHTSVSPWDMNSRQWDSDTSWIHCWEKLVNATTGTATRCIHGCLIYGQGQDLYIHFFRYSDPWASSDQMHLTTFRTNDAPHWLVRYWRTRFKKDYHS